MRLLLIALLAVPAALRAQPLESPETQAAARGLIRAAQEAPDDAIGPEEAGDVTDEEASRPPTAVAAGVWRSSRLNEVGLTRLYDMGVKTIVNLEGGKPYRQEKELLLRIEAKRAAEGKPAWHITSIAVPMSGISAPTFGQMDRALALLSNAGRQPVLVHCKHGEDRTGVTVAAFRVEIERRLSVLEACAEAKTFHCCHLVVIGEHGLERYLKAYLSYKGR